MKNLRIMLVTVLAMFLSIPALAQNRIGFIGGVNLANVDFKSDDPDADEVDFSNLLGIGAGGILELALSENVALRFEPKYLQKGAKDEESSQGVNVESKIKLAYVEVPALLKYTIGTSSTRPYLLAGPSLGFVLSAKATLEASGGGVNIDEEDDIKDVVKSTDFGLNFGGGVSFPAGNNVIFLEGLYNLGLSNVNDDPDDPDTEVKNKGIHIMAGVTMPLGGN
jgi:opacity protein-like surface antigen